MVAATLALSAAGAHATIYSEGGTDAGDLPATAQLIPTPLNNGITAITGQTVLTNGLSDSDMFGFTVSVPETLNLSTTGFAPGVNNFDTQLAVFNANGTGVAANDDAASGGSQSSLTVALQANVEYYVLLSGSGRYAVDSSSALIFPNYTDGTTDPSATVGPISPNSIDHYTGNSNEAGMYSIALTVVPEPATYFHAALIAGLAGWTMLARRRRLA